MMRVVPVLDLIGGQVVRGVAGRRAEYRPWISPLAGSSDPLAVARAFRSRFGLDTLYVADLDLIELVGNHRAELQTLADDGFSVWVDAGVRRPVDAVAAGDAGATRVVVGLETVWGVASLEAAARAVPEAMFSLDLKNGVPIAHPEWRTALDGPDPAMTAVRLAVECGVTSVLVLDLARVGVGTGLGTEPLLARIRKAFPQVALVAGGGVRNRDDLVRLADLGVSAALVASALHSGDLTRADVDAVA